MPLIALSCPEFHADREAVFTGPILASLRMFGADVLLVSGTMSQSTLGEVVGACDGIVLSGVSSGAADAQIDIPDPLLEQRILTAWDRGGRKQALLAIGRGVYEMAAWHGAGTAFVAGHGSGSHLVRLTESAQAIWPRDIMFVESSHNEVIVPPLTGALEAIATAEDGSIEAIRRTGHGFAVGVQWRPDDATWPDLVVLEQFLKASTWLAQRSTDTAFLWERETLPDPRRLA